MSLNKHYKRSSKFNKKSGVTVDHEIIQLNLYSLYVRTKHYNQDNKQIGFIR